MERDLKTEKMDGPLGVAGRRRSAVPGDDERIDTGVMVPRPRSARGVCKSLRVRGRAAHAAARISSLGGGTTCETERESPCPARVASTPPNSRGSPALAAWTNPSLESRSGVWLLLTDIVPSGVWLLLTDIVPSGVWLLLADIVPCECRSAWRSAPEEGRSSPPGPGYVSRAPPHERRSGVLAFEEGQAPSPAAGLLRLRSWDCRRRQASDAARRCGFGEP